MSRFAPFALILFLFPGAVVAQTPFTVGTVTAQPGTIASGTLDVPGRGSDQGATIPFTIINGAAAGPPGRGSGERRQALRPGARRDGPALTAGHHTPRTISGDTRASLSKSRSR